VRVRVVRMEVMIAVCFRGLLCKLIYKSMRCDSWRFSLIQQERRRRAVTSLEHEFRRRTP
jgi:hypothetical protein